MRRAPMLDARHFTEDTDGGTPGPALPARDACPLSRQEFRALGDCGMRHAQIAEYFQLEPRHVCLLCATYGL